MYAIPFGYRYKIPDLSKVKSIHFKKASLILAGALIGGVIYFNSTLPGLDNIGVNTPISSKIYDRNGALLYEIHGEHKRTPIKLDQMSPALINATIAIEDKDFYKHNGISGEAITRAAIKNAQAREVRQGGSTITQQLAKMSLLTNERTLKRKAKEWLLAMKIENRFSKDEILEMYLNQTPYGRNTYGVSAASLVYFAKPAKDLSIAESAYLAAIPKAPSLYSPGKENNPELESRKNFILERMHELDYISAEELAKAKEEVVHFQSSTTELEAPYFVKMVEQDLINKYGRNFLETEGLHIQTTLDLELQVYAEKVVKDGAVRNATRGASNAALVAIEPKTGYITALVGGKDYFAAPEPKGCTPGKNCTFDPSVNVATSLRQPGSSFKPYTYVTAFTEKYKFSPSSKILDKTQNFAKPGPGVKPYRPVNYNGKEYGVITMRRALAGSLNVSAVRTLSQLDIKDVINNVKAFGINSPMQSCGLSLTLGACEVSLLEHVSAYSTLANMGERVTPTALLKITDKKGNVLYEHQVEKERVIDAQAVYQVVDIMTDNRARTYIFGARSPLILKDRIVAAKTGTSQDFKDGWTVGFTPQLAVGVWAGNNNGKLMRMHADGVVVAAPIWNAFMTKAHEGKVAENFPVPDGIQRVRVSTDNGLLATSFTPSATTEIFASYSIPTRKDTYIPRPKDDEDEDDEDKGIKDKDGKVEGVLTEAVSIEPSLISNQTSN